MRGGDKRERRGRGPTPKGMVGDLLLREGRGLLLRAPHYRYWPPYSLNPGYGPARWGKGRYTAAAEHVCYDMHCLLKFSGFT